MTFPQLISNYNLTVKNSSPHEHILGGLSVVDTSKSYRNRQSSPYHFDTGLMVAQLIEPCSDASHYSQRDHSLIVPKIQFRTFQRSIRRSYSGKNQFD